MGQIMLSPPRIGPPLPAARCTRAFYLTTIFHRVLANQLLRNPKLQSPIGIRTVSKSGSEGKKGAYMGEVYVVLNQLLLVFGYD